MITFSYHNLSLEVKMKSFSAVFDTYI